MTTELVNYEELLAGLAKKATASEKPSSSSIGTKAGVLTYGGQPVPDNKLDCIIIASTHANLYYEDAYDPNNIKSPVCFAYSEGDDEGAEARMVPHPASSKPQHSDCKTCPKNAWGSDPKGGKGKACKNSRVLALIPAGTKAEDIVTAEMASLALPVMSVENWSQYVNKCSALFNRPPLAMYTQIGTKPDPKSQFRVTFLNTALVPNEMIKPLIDKAEAAQSVIKRVYEPNPEVAPESTGKKKY